MMRALFDAHIAGNPSNLSNPRGLRIRCRRRPRCAPPARRRRRPQQQQQRRQQMWAAAQVRMLFTVSSRPHAKVNSGLDGSVIGWQC